MSSTPGFRHEALPDPKSYIRLLEILNGGPNKQIACRLTAWSIQDAPPYYALSYTWGNPNETTKIVINGKTASVTANCEYALRQAHTCAKDKYFWMDALSIDQSSTHEKGFQVAMMGRIYEKAAHVLACIGPQAEDSQFLLEVIHTDQSLLRHISSLMSGNLVSGTGGWSLPNPIPNTRWLGLRCFFAMNVSRRKRLLGSFMNMMERPYFSRVWVLQELHSASRISFCCGNDIRPFASLAAIGMLIDYWMLRDARKWSWLWITRVVVDILSRIPWVLRRQKCLWTSSARQRYAAMFVRHGSLALASGTKIGCRLSDVMRAMLQFDCADVRDKLYGVLSLVDWGSSRIPTPDYTKDAFSLAVEILHIYLTDKKVAPRDKTVLESAQQLCAVFKLSPSQTSMSMAIRARCSESHTVAQLLHFTAMALDRQQVDRSLPPFISFSPYTDLKGSILRTPNDNWYGVQLLDESDARRRDHAEDLDYYLFLRTSSSKQAVEIVDKEGSIIAYAPKHTQTHDIYVFTFWDDLDSTSVSGMIVRTERPGIYTLLGHAPGREKKETYWNWMYSGSDFQVQWSAEDLLVYCWAHRNAVLAIDSLAEVASWLELRICGRRDSSGITLPVYLQSRFLPRDESMCIS